ncbi:phthiocerol/phthiodiolone dimycocerosyl transferase family protein [Nocardia sp. CA-128927]|uniref:phthiocerol/phthiodiolone dimycocerosyl transferase family protein n=1 Tax=Nocardia sp. CA-128927 TaxID=3239975 RepID=UPI003D975553
MNTHIASVQLADLSSGERYFLAGDARVVIAATVEGALDVDRMRAAYDALALEYPVVSCRFVDADEGGARLVTGATTATSVSTADRDIYWDQPAPPVDKARNMVRLDIIGSGGRYLVALVAHHAIWDGRLCVEVFTRLWHRYADPSAEIRAPRLQHSDQQVLREHGFAAVPQAEVDEVLRRRSQPFATVALEPGTLAGRHRVRLTEAVTGRVLDAAAQGHPSVHGIVCAAVLLAERRFLGEAGALPMAIRTYVDLREVLIPPVASAEVRNLVGSSWSRGMVAPDSEVLPLAVALQKQLTRDLTSGVLGFEAVDSADRWNPAVDVSGVSNMGVLPDLSAGAVTVTDVRGFTEGGGVPPWCYFVNTYADRLSIELVWFPDTMSADTAQRILAEAAAQLELTR